VEGRVRKERLKERERLRKEREGGREGKKSEREWCDLF